GLEAILVLTALSGYLRKVGAERHLPSLRWGAALAIALSFAAALTIGYLPQADGFYLLDAALVIAAAGLMLYVSGWLFLFQPCGRWQEYLRDRTAEAAAAQTWPAMALIAFVAVFREGVEIVLFIHALARSTGGWSSALLLGLLAAGACLAILYVLTNALAAKL